MYGEKPQGKRGWVWCREGLGVQIQWSKRRKAKRKITGGQVASLELFSTAFLFFSPYCRLTPPYTSTSRTTPQL